METRKRTVVKALIWNLIGLAVMALVGVIFTGSFTAGGMMAAINSAIGLSSYFLYERLWTRIHWGRCLE